jgi:hypothetical protein
MRNFRYYVLAVAVSGCLGALPIACASGGVSGEPEGQGGRAGASTKTNVAGHSSIGGRSSIGGAAGAGSSVAAGGTKQQFSGSIDVSGTDTSTEIECAQHQVSIKALPPDIMIIMDRSMSMTDDVSGQACAGGSLSGDGNCGDASKWNQTIVAVKAVVQDTQAAVNWGMFWLGNEAAQCGAGTSPIVPITSGDSYTPIRAALDSNQFTGAIGTPTATVVNNSVKYMKTLTDANPKYLLVATDGEPNCASGTSVGGFGGGSTSYNADITGSTNAVASALKAGIQTFVVGIATTSSTTSTASTASTALDSMADAGGNPQVGAATKYYEVTDTESLKSTLNQIIGLATSCTVSLDNTPQGQWTIAISAQDDSGETVEVPNDPTDGWSYTDESTKASIQLSGTACDNLKNGKYSNLQFVYTCPDHKIVL